MRSATALILLLVLSACGDAGSPDRGLTVPQAQANTCREVNEGIAEFNRGDYAGTVEHFEKAKIPATVLSRISDEPEADALLDAVQYYANLDPADYPEAARSSEHFARNKAITLGQCAPLDGGEPASPV
ncbi:hypothetical protein [Aeromicrobium sp. NPDC092404]|uniref:hypothetical protein n=1 Tax=Aeromicrobium sp. NPDC092404 TaxID=3154976 RepID=UPI00342F2EDE